LLAQQESMQANGQINPQTYARRLTHWQRLEQVACWQADAVLVPNPEAVERLVNMGVAAQKITCITAALDLHTLSHVRIDANLQRLYKHPFLLTVVTPYMGADDGLTHLLQALHLLRWHLPDLRCAVVITVVPPPAALLALQTLSQDLGLVHIVDWILPPTDTDADAEHQAIQYVAPADVCLVPHTPLGQAYLPTQVYLYHSMGKPILGAEQPPLQRYLNQTQGLGAVAWQQPDLLANGIWQLHQNPALRKQLADAGRNAALTQHNWTLESPKWLGCLQGVLTAPIPPDGAEGMQQAVLSAEALMKDDRSLASTNSLLAMAAMASAQMQQEALPSDVMPTKERAT
jgi:glycosyltransferase involved in cell wall biosynthesis